MKNFFQQILSDVDGQGSSKRVATFWLLTLISAITVGVTFFHAYFNETIWTDLLLAFAASIGLVTYEKYNKRKEVTGVAPKEKKEGE